MILNDQQYHIDPSGQLYLAPNERQDFVDGPSESNRTFNMQVPIGVHLDNPQNNDSPYLNAIPTLKTVSRFKIDNKSKSPKLTDHSKSKLQYTFSQPFN